MTWLSRLVPLLVVVCTPASAEPLQLKAHPIRNFAIASTERRFGPLEFLGGIELTSADRQFGGISGIEVTSNGRRAILVSDDGFIVTGALRHEEGLLTGFDGAEIDWVFPGQDSAKHENDIEDIALDPADLTRGALVLERRSAPLMAFSLADERLEDLRPIPFSGDPRLFRSNRGLESVAFAPATSPAAGRVVVIAEGTRRSDRIPGWIIGSGRFDVVKRDAFDVSSARFLPDGDLLLLERRFAPGWGVGMRLRRIAGDTIRPGAELDGEVLIEAGLLNQIDNMEGLSVHQDEAGRTVLTLISDDNKHVLQRTVLLQFALDD